MTITEYNVDSMCCIIVKIKEKYIIKVIRTNYIDTSLTIMIA